MKIKKIQLQNNAILGDIELDFCDKTGNIATTVIFAGENGCGKTTLLDIIYDFPFSKMNMSSNETRLITVELRTNELDLIQKSISPSLSHDISTTNSLIFEITPPTQQGMKISYIATNNRTVNFTPLQISSFLSNYGSKKYTSIFNTIYSTAEINYTPKNSTTITSKELDSPMIKSIRSNTTDLATEIQQLLIDVQNNDAIELNEWVREHLGVAPDENIVDRRIKRFKNAFSEIFTDLNYNSIKTANGKKEVLFKKNQSDIPISKLSSGEKQIVFRGAFLLKDKESLSGSIVLIDEPEISLHPRWQEKILDFNRKLFIDSNGIQQSQLFLSTHSPYIIHSNTRVDDKIIILKKTDDKIIVDTNSTYVSAGADIAIREAFHTSWFHHENPLIITEGCSDWKHMKAAFTNLMLSKEFSEEFFDVNFDFFEYEPLNSDKAAPLKAQMSNTELVTMCKNLSAVMQHQKLIFIADCDAKTQTKDLVVDGSEYKAWGNNVYSFELPVPPHRQETPEICIEHYYTDEEIKTSCTENGIPRRIYMGNEFNSKGISTGLKLVCSKKDSCGPHKINILDGSSKTRINDIEDGSDTNYGLSKNSFAEKILSDEVPFNNMDFSSFLPLFRIIKKILAEP